VAWPKKEKIINLTIILTGSDMNLLYDGHLSPLAAKEHAKRLDAFLRQKGFVTAQQTAAHAPPHS
jgi:oligoribonuclease (3'-5' exoribonuclease)